MTRDAGPPRQSERPRFITGHPHAPRPSPVVGVGAVVIDRAGLHPSVLLVKRGRPPAEGTWSLPGGRVEGGERLSEAVRREIAEETGLFVIPGPLLAVAEIIDEAHHYVVLDYLCHVEGGSLHAGDDAREATFVALPNLAVYGVTAAVADVIDRALALLSGAPSPPAEEDEITDEPTLNDDETKVEPPR